MNISITAPDFDSFMKRISDRVDVYETRKSDFLKSLAEIGIIHADIKFRNALYDGTNDVVVDSGAEWIDENTIAVHASGESILFIEFGTGVYNPGVHPKANEMGMLRGEYGRKQGKNKAWVYYGETGTNGEQLKDGRVKTHGNNPNRCMWSAAENMRRQILNIAKEAFVQ